MVRRLLRPGQENLEDLDKFRLRAFTRPGGDQSTVGKGPLGENLQRVQAAALGAFHTDPVMAMHCAAALWAAADRLSCDPVVRLENPRPGFNMWVPPYRDVLAEHVRGKREPHCASKFQEEVSFRSGDVGDLVLLDVGAAYGDCAVWACAALGVRAKVYSYEPVAEAANALRRTLELNPTAECSAKVREVALDAFSSEARNIAAPQRMMSGARLDSQSERDDAIVELRQAITTTVVVETLDREAERQGWSHIDVLKVHVEGLEMAVLEGGRHVALPRTRSVIARGGRTESWRRRIADTLRGLGFTVISEGYHVLGRRE